MITKTTVFDYKWTDLCADGVKLITRKASFSSVRMLLAILQIRLLNRLLDFTDGHDLTKYDLTILADGSVTVPPNQETEFAREPTLSQAIITYLTPSAISFLEKTSPIGVFCGFAGLSVVVLWFPVTMLFISIGSMIAGIWQIAQFALSN